MYFMYLLAQDNFNTNKMGRNGKKKECICQFLQCHCRHFRNKNRPSFFSQWASDILHR